MLFPQEVDYMGLECQGRAFHMSLPSTIPGIHYSQPWLAEVLIHRVSPGEKGAERHFVDGEWERLYGQGRALSQLLVDESHGIEVEMVLQCCHPSTSLPRPREKL